MTAKRFFPVLLLLAAAAPFAAAQQVWSLEQCIAHAQSNRVDVARQQNAIEAQRVRLQAARDGYAPVVEANVTSLFNYGMNMDLFIDASLLYLPARIEAHMPLFDWSLRSRRQAEDYGLRAAEAQAAQQQQQIALAVTTYYLQAVYAKNMVALARDMVALDTQHVAYIQRRYSDGAAAESELARARLACAADYKSFVMAEGMASQALAELRYIIHCSDSFDVAEGAEALLAPECGADTADAGIAARRLELLSSQSALACAKSARYPTLTLHAALGGFTYTLFDRPEALDFDRSFWNNRNAMVWLNLNIPILNLSGTRSAIRAGKAAVTDCQLALDEAVSQRLQQVALLRDKIATGRAAAEQAARVAAAAEQLYQAEKERYDNGYGGWFELQEAKKQYCQARAEQLNSRIQLAMNSRMLALYLGAKQ